MISTSDAPADEHPMRALGRRLEAALRRKGWTYREFAERTGISKSTLQYMIRRRQTALEYHELTALVAKLDESWTDEWEQLWQRATETPPPRADNHRPASQEAITRAGKVPAQLPPDARGFTGRVRELAELDRLRDQAGKDPTAAAIAVASGTAGVGKTALALKWANHRRVTFPDGQLYVNLRGYDADRPMPVDDALAGFLRSLGVSGSQLPIHLDERVALWRTMLEDRRILIVLDNAANAEQVRPLLPGAGSCFVIVTSRNTLAGLVARDGAYRITLDPLPPAEAEALLQVLIGDRVAADPVAAASLAQHCARLPLALRLAAEVATDRPDVSLADLAQDLACQHRRLDLLDADGDRNAAVRDAFSWSYRNLPDEVARAFRLLGLHPTARFGSGAAAALLDTERNRAVTLLDRLMRAHLVQPTGVGHYGMHDLLRAYAMELADATEAQSSRHMANQRMLDFYLQTAYAANRKLEPHRLPITIQPAQSTVIADNMHDAAGGLAWFASEHQALVAAIDRAAKTGFDTYAWQLAWTMTTFFERQGLWHDWVNTQQAALAATQRLADRPAQASTQRTIARALSWLDKHDAAQTHLEQALELYIEAGDHAGQARTHLNLSAAVERQGRHNEAMKHDQLALDLFITAGDRFGQGCTLNQLGCDHILLGNPQQAIVFCTQALIIFEELDDQSGRAAVLDSLGSAHQRMRQYPPAITSYLQAIHLYQQLSDRYHEADSLIHLGETYEADNDPTAAHDAWTRAATILDNIDHARAHEIHNRLHRLAPAASQIRQPSAI